jgi:hypothetical protein
MVRRFPYSILIAVACVLVMLFWGADIVAWLTRER